MRPCVQLEHCQGIPRSLLSQQIVSPGVKRFSSMQEVKPQLTVKACFAASSPSLLAKAAASGGDGGGGMAPKCFTEISPFCLAVRSISPKALQSDFNFASKKETTILHAS